MQERLSELNGQVEVTTSRGAGFRVEVTIPRGAPA
jgi:signal transduction histidine kinase